MRPEYANWLMTAIVDQGQWVWYVLYITWCYLDQVKAGLHYFGPDSEKTKENIHHRFDIPVVNENTKNRFLRNIKSYQVSTEDIRKMLMEETDPIEKDAFWPTFLIDFDEKRFMSQYQEMELPEEFVPDGWTGSYADFSSEVPEEMRYWISEDGKNLLEEE